MNYRHNDFKEFLYLIWNFILINADKVLLYTISHSTKNKIISKFNRIKGINYKQSKVRVAHKLISLQEIMQNIKIYYSSYLYCIYMYLVCIWQYHIVNSQDKNQNLLCWIIFLYNEIININGEDNISIWGNNSIFLKGLLYKYTCLQTNKAVKKTLVDRSFDSIYYCPCAHCRCKKI